MASKDPDQQKQISIIRLKDMENPVDAEKQIDEIFFTTTRIRNFSNPKERRDFHYRWLGYYRKCEPDSFFLALAENSKIAGYLAGSLDTLKMISGPNRIDSLQPFQPYCASFPAHLHINILPGFRFQGAGQALISEFLGYCWKNNVPGVHIITSREAENFRFYRKSGFRPVAQNRFEDRILLMLGIRDDRL